jgi:hypothetical protein
VFGGLALEGGEWAQRGGVGSDNSFLYTLGLHLDGHIAKPYMSGHVALRAALGGGGNGFETWTNLLLTAGVRGQVDDNHGPYIRGGIGFDRIKSDRFFWYRFELPVVEAGYQYFSPDLLLEAGFIGGGALLGQLATGNTGSRVLDSDGELDQIDNISDGPRASRTLGTAGEAGVSVTVQFLGVRATARAERIFSQTGPKTPIDVAGALLCFSPIDGFAACAEGQHFRGDFIRSDDHTVVASSATFLGGLLAFGAVVNDTPK